MRRAILAVTGTIVGLVALLSFKSHVPAVAAASGTGVSSGGTSGSGSGSSGSGSAGSGSAGSTSGGQGFATGKQTGLPADEHTVTGNVANTIYGPVQIQLVVKDSKIVKVSVLQQPSNTIHDIQIGQFAFPRLIGETLAAQDAKIDSISGATYTSGGYIQSLQSSVDKGL
ncbi:MAG: FMN-binding protein [Streptosporangiaceae bacterium]